MQIGPDEVGALARGCAVLGSGGGGSVRDASLLLEATLAECGPVSVVPPGDLRGSDRTALLGAVGSPTVMVELLPSSREFVTAARGWEAHVGERLAAVTTLEIGGVNGLLAVNVAARLGIPLLDADAMGRAFPRLELTMLSGHVPITPLVLADARHRTMVLDGFEVDETDETVRRVLPTFGTWAAVCLHGCTIADIAEHAVQGSVSRAIELGRAVAEGSGTGLEPLFSGTVIEVLRAHGSEPGGVVTMQGLDDADASLRIDFLDEFVVASVDGRPVAYAPDVIALLDRGHAPVLADEVRVGQRLTLVRLPAPPELQRSAPRFGLAAYAMAEVSGAAS